MSLTGTPSTASHATLFSSLLTEVGHGIKPPADVEQFQFSTYVEFLSGLFPRFMRTELAAHHHEFWDWVWSIRAGERSQPFVAIWPRGGAKSTMAELACVAVGARQTRTYILYICATQERADSHVDSIMALLESSAVATYFPALGSPKVGKHGTAKGWRRNRLRTASGLTIDAIGLDTAARGTKVEEQRPDLMIVDDIDHQHDAPGTVQKKIETLTRALFPAGSVDATVLAVQNLIHANGVFARLVDGRADFLADRIVSGPFPALRDFSWEVNDDGTVTILTGEPTWAWQSREVCAEMIRQMGLTAFRVESQQEVDAGAGGLFKDIQFRHCRREDVPPLRRISVWVDPAVTDTDESDSYGLQVDGMDDNGLIYRLYSWEERTSPQDALERAILAARDYGADAVGIETDQGGDTWKVVYQAAGQQLIKDGTLPAGYRFPRYTWAKAGSSNLSKVGRATLMLPDYENGKIVHVLGTHAILEAALRRFGKTKPFDLVDAGYWCWNDLRNKTPFDGGTAPESNTKPSVWTTVLG